MVTERDHQLDPPGKVVVARSARSDAPDHKVAQGGDMETLVG